MVNIACNNINTSQGICWHELLVNSAICLQWLWLKCIRCNARLRLMNKKWYAVTTALHFFLSKTKTRKHKNTQTYNKTVNPTWTKWIEELITGIFIVQDCLCKEWFIITFYFFTFISSLNSQICKFYIAVAKLAI